jgi:hypothetical protein
MCEANRRTRLTPMAYKSKPKLAAPKKSGHDPDEAAFALDALLLGFDLGGFDAWLAQYRGNSSIRTWIQARRKAALAAHVRDDFEMERSLLELLDLAWHSIRREAFLLPLAKKEQKARAYRAKGGRNRAGKLSKAKEFWLKAAIVMREKNPKRGLRDIATEVARARNADVSKPADEPESKWETARDWIGGQARWKELVASQAAKKKRVAAIHFPT